MELLKLLKLLQLVDAWSSFQTLIIRTEKIFYDVSKYCSWVAVVYDNVRMIICTYQVHRIQVRLELRLSKLAALRQTIYPSCINFKGMESGRKKETEKRL